jgi:hypothetical protein
VSTIRLLFSPNSVRETTGRKGLLISNMIRTVQKISISSSVDNILFQPKFTPAPTASNGLYRRCANRMGKGSPSCAPEARPDLVTLEVRLKTRRRCGERRHVINSSGHAPFTGVVWQSTSGWALFSPHCGLCRSVFA